MNAICSITFRPTDIYCHFLNSFSNYKVFVVVDDNEFDLSNFIQNYENITFIQINNELCRNSGYIDLSFTINKLISGWDKALYHFGIVDTSFEYIWFMEDDVFFHNEDTLIQIDNTYTNTDLLSNNYVENVDGDKSTWHWNIININHPPPYYWAMICIIRLSKNMMNCIHEYATTHKTLFFSEALFPTTAFKNNLSYECPSVFNNIFYRHDFKKEDITTIGLYHPVKNINHHVEFREHLNIMP